MCGRSLVTESKEHLEPDTAEHSCSEECKAAGGGGGVGGGCKERGKAGECSRDQVVVGLLAVLSTLGFTQQAMGSSCRVCIGALGLL